MFDAAETRPYNEVDQTPEALAHPPVAEPWANSQQLHDGQDCADIEFDPYDLDPPARFIGTCVLIALVVLAALVYVGLKLVGV